MIYSFNRIVAEISKYFTLQIGDLIFTGTPAGVGEVFPGDVLEGFIETESLFKLEVK
jgi:2-keto-4-pentenoate hydratase/2-oxohepta-3-ene-1,7-dioic acid hydratase in catechol pathway